MPKRLHVVQTIVQHVYAPKPPAGFSLNAEEESGGPVYFREFVEEVDQPARVDADGTALGGDDDAVEAPSEKGPIDA
jgi:hypothetical protein